MKREIHENCLEIHDESFSQCGFGEGVLCAVKFTGSLDGFPCIAGLENLPFASRSLVFGASVLVDGSNRTLFTKWSSPLGCPVGSREGIGRE